MSTDSQPVKAKAASNSSREAPALPDQSDTRNLSKKKLDMEAVFKEAWEKSEKMTDEEKLKKFPWLKDPPPPGVPADKAMQILEEMEEQERREAEAEDEDERARADKAS